MTLQRKIVQGQRVSLEKAQLARAFRKNPTPTERLLWSRLRNGQLGGLHFRREQCIDGFIVDFYCHLAGLIVEVDGGVHKDQQEADEDRTLAFGRRGLVVMRVSVEDVTNRLHHVLSEIKDRCRILIEAAKHSG